MQNGMLRVEEVAVLLQCSINTINAWYRFRAENPADEYAQMLPDYIQVGGRTSPRLWKQEDISRLLEFKHRRPLGRNGVMGTVTQRYVKHNKEDK